MVEPEFRELGFKTEWIDMSAAGRAGHLVARHSGRRSGKRLLLIAHLDTVFEPDSPFQRWAPEGTLAHGPGSGDDKGGIAVIVAALRAMSAAGTLKNANITIFLTGDEEDAGSPLEVSRRDLIAEGKKADVALDFEDLSVEDGNDVGSIARRSAGSWTLTVTGKSAHSAGWGGPGVGYGAIYELARIIDEFRKQLPEDKLTYNVGLAGGGQSATFGAGKIRLEATGKTNIVAPIAVARGDLRAISQDQIERTRDQDARHRCAIAPRDEGRDQLRRRCLPADAANRGQSRTAGPAERRQPRHGTSRDGRARPVKARCRRYQLRCRGRRRPCRPWPVELRLAYGARRRSMYRRSSSRQSVPPS